MAPQPAIGRAGSDRPRPRFARVYARLAPGMEQAGLGALRDELLADLHGRVLEVGCGSGGNFSHYGGEVEALTAVEPEPYLRGLAVHVAREVPTPIEVLPGTAEALPLPTASVDAAVLCLVLCSVDDPLRALHELRRVVRPGGELRFLEHTVAPTAHLRRIQRLLDATVWPHLAGGCHTSRDATAMIGEAGFRVVELRRFRFPDTRFTFPTSPHTLGRAERTAA